MSQTATEGGNTGAQGNNGGAPQLPPGVAQNSAAATAFQGQQGGDNGQAGDQSANNGGKPAGYVPVAEVAQERQRRHELETKVTQLQEAQTKQLEAFKTALGLKPEQTADEAAKALQRQQEEHRTALVQLSVHQLATTAGADPARLLDSRSFLESIKNLQPTDHAGIAAAITKALESNTTLSATARNAGAGSRDAAQGGNAGGNKPSMSDLLRSAAGR